MAFISWIRQPATFNRTVDRMLISRTDHLVWFVMIAVVALLVPFVFTSVLDVQHDVYYLLYFTISLCSVAAYVAATGFDLESFIQRSWRLSLVLGAASAVFLVWNVLGRNDATPHPDGPYFAFEIAWRGLAYGIVDAILLNVFPAMVAFSLLERNVAGLRRRLSFAVLALLLTVTITATYHLGYSQFRNSDLVKPETGNIVIELPTLVAVNPLGSVLAHTCMHLAAVTHTYETDTFLPPQVFVDEPEGD